ncbi:MAG: lamin tail domain-containing protein, partial [Myxococcota bacterium]
MRCWTAWGGLSVMLVMASPGVASAQAPFISEIFFDPAGSEAAQEWVEIHNPGTSAVDLGGWKVVSRSSGNTKTFTLPAGVSIAAGGALVVANNATLGDAVPCPLAAASWGSAVTLYNSSGASVALEDGTATEVDRVSYIGGGMPAGQEAHTLAVVDLAAGNDNVANWAVSDCPFGSSFGTPGRPNFSCAGGADGGPTFLCPEIPDAGPPDAAPPAPATRPFFSEIFYDSPVTSDTGSEWLELYNPTDTDVDMTGWIIRSIGSSTRTHELPSGTVIPAQDVLLIAAEADLGAVAGCAVAPAAYGSALTLYNSGSARVELVDDVGDLVDGVTYLGGGMPDAPAGASLAVVNYNGAGGNDDVSNWQATSCAYGSRDYSGQVLPSHGSPGLPNSACVGATPVTLECLPVPDAGVTDGGTVVIGRDASPGRDALGLLEPLDAGPQSNSAPTVTITEPTANVVAGTGGVTVSWSASDPDGDVLAISILRSAVGAGQSGEEVLTGLAASGTQTWDTAGTPPGVYRVLVRAADGHGNVAVAEAPGTVEVKLTDPSGGAVFVDRPRGGETVDDKLTITVRSTATDGTISVFYDTDGAGLDGKPIQGGIRARVGVVDVVWSTLS